MIAGSEVLANTLIFLTLGISIVAQDTDAVATLPDDIEFHSLDTILKTHGFKQKPTMVLSSNYLSFIHHKHRIDFTLKKQLNDGENSFLFTNYGLQFTKGSTVGDIHLQLHPDQASQFNAFINEKYFPVDLPSPFNQNVRMFLPRFIKYRERIGETLIFVYKIEEWLTSSIPMHKSSLSEVQSYVKLSNDEFTQYVQDYLHYKLCLHSGSFDNQSLAVNNFFPDIRKIWYDGTLASPGALIVIQAFFYSIVHYQYQLKRPCSEAAYDYKAPGKSQIQQLAKNMAQSFIGFYTQEQNPAVDKIKNLRDVVTFLLSYIDSLKAPDQILSPQIIEAALLARSKTSTFAQSSMTRTSPVTFYNFHSLWASPYPVAYLPVDFAYRGTLEQTHQSMTQ